MQVMEMKYPHVRTQPLKCAPTQPQCPNWGKLGKRKDVLHRQVRSIAYKQVVCLEFIYGEYRARCDCGTTFRTTPPGVDPRALYFHKVRHAVLDRILEDGMSIEQVLRSMHRDFFLDLSDGFVYDCLHDRVRQLDMADHRRWVLDHLSGTLCIDELHLGRYPLLLATDPLQDLPVAFALVQSNDHDHMRGFLQNLKNWGVEPEVVVTDGSGLYPALGAVLWPQARHQLCIFHVLKDGHQQVLDALRRLRRGLARRGQRGRKTRRGRRRKARAKSRGRTNKEKSAFIFKHRSLILKRRERMSSQERLDREKMLCYLPELKTLRDFADRLELLFEESQSEALAWGRQAALTSHRRFLTVPALAAAVAMLEAAKFAQMIAFLKSPAYHRVRTNNHVERVNRKLRYQEKARYKWRQRRMIVRFMVLLMDRYWNQERQNRSRLQEEVPSQPRNRSSPKRKPVQRVA